MHNRSVDVLIIGGGATGAGLLRDLALRGIRALLVERGDLSSGTTGRYHGLLHSGARYVVKDPAAARDCASENTILRRILPHCIEDTGGLFVATPWDDLAYADGFEAACGAQGVACEELPVAKALRREPALNPRIARAFAVPDCSVDSFLAVEANVQSARAHGAELLTYHRVTALVREGDRVVGAVVEDRRTGAALTISAALVVNAAGPWSGQVAALAGVPLTVVSGKGTMLALNHRLVNTVVNRCKPPGDGDIIVPIRTVCVAGTTDIVVKSPDDIAITPEEVALILEEGDKLVPGLAHARVLRAWAGARPLYKERPGLPDHDLSRDFKLLDHQARDGVAGLLSIVGGKFSTYRLMAERTGDLVARRLGVAAACRTHMEPISPPAQRRFFWPGAPLASVDRELGYDQLICECELVTRAQVEAAISAGASNLDDVRRDVRLGMGPCQGGFCIYRAAALLHELRPASAAANVAMRDFLQERWRGLTPVLWGDQLRQERLDELIYLGVLAIDLLPPDRPTPDWLVADHDTP
jgi:glycerol-3-phosphate dehydrogenase